MKCLNSFAFVFNSVALGDVVATIPAVKYMIETFYSRNTYLVVAKGMFRECFHFVPDHNFYDLDNFDLNLIPKDWAIGTINQKVQPGSNIIRNTPKSMLLGQFGAFRITDRFFEKNQLNYEPLIPVDVSKFNTDFSRSVVFVTTYRDETRCWKSEYIIELAAWVKSKGFIPVFIGKTDMDVEEKHMPKSDLPTNLNFNVVDLRNQTSIGELATIMRMSKAIVGLDSGPIHLAGTTSTPIVCGYTTVDNKYRIPIRKKGIAIPIIPEVNCRFCESEFAAQFWSFEKCPFGKPTCCDEMTPDKFIKPLKKILKVN